MISLNLRAARMSVLGRALKSEIEFPVTLGFPGDAEHGRTEMSFPDRTALERILTEAQVNAVNDGLAIYTLPDGGFLLAEKNSADPWGDHVKANAPRSGWLGIGRGWLAGERAI